MSDLFINVNNDIYRESINSIYLHEDAAYNYLVNNNLIDKVTGNYMNSIELCILDNLVINTSCNAIIIYLPDRLNSLQKQYLYYIKQYLKNNFNKVWVCDICNIDGKVEIINHSKFEDKSDLDYVLNRKLDNDYKVLVK